MQCLLPYLVILSKSGVLFLLGDILDDVSLVPSLDDPTPPLSWDSQGPYEWGDYLAHNSFILGDLICSRLIGCHF